MKVETDGEGRKKFALGPVELSLICLLPGVLGFMWIRSEAERSTTISEIGKSNSQVVIQISVLQEQVRVLSLQFGSSQLQGLPDRMTRMETKVEQLRADTDELRDMRGLK